MNLGWLLGDAALDLGFDPCARPRHDLISRCGDELIHLRAEIARYGGSPLVNVNSDEGQLSSILTALPPVEAAGASAMVVMPVDVPLISAEVIKMVVAAAETESVSIVRAAHKGVHGHPVLFKRAVFDELRRADPSLGARTVVRADPARVKEVEVANVGVTLDIDTPEDYLRAFGRSL